MEIFKIIIFAINFAICLACFAAMLKLFIYNAFQLLFVSCWLERKFEFLDMFIFCVLSAFFLANSILAAFSLGWI